MLTSPVTRRVLSSSCDTVSSMRRSDCGFKNGTMPSITSTSARAASRSLQTIPISRRKPGAYARGRCRQCSSPNAATTDAVLLPKYLKNSRVRLQHQHIAGVSQCCPVGIHAAVELVKLLVLAIGLCVDFRGECITLTAQDLGITAAPRQESRCDPCQQPPGSPWRPPDPGREVPRQFVHALRACAEIPRY